MQNAADNNKPPESEYSAEITNMPCNPIYIVIYKLFPTKITYLVEKQRIIYRNF